MGPWRGSLGESLVLADSWVRMFWSSGLVDRPSDRLYVRTIPLSGCMDRRYCYAPFSSKTWLACHSKTCALAASPEELPPYGIPRQGPPGTWNVLDVWTAWGVPQTETVSSMNWEAYNLGASSTLVTRFYRKQQQWNTFLSGFLNSPGDFCWLESPIRATAVLRGKITLQRSFNAGKMSLLLVDQTVR